MQRMGKATQQDFQNRVAKQGWYVGVGSFMQFLDFYDTNQISFKYIQLISKVIPEHHPLSYGNIGEHIGKHLDSKNV